MRESFSAEDVKNRSQILTLEDIENAEVIGHSKDVEPGEPQLPLWKTRDGRLFYEIRKDREQQAAVAGLLKGTIATSDVCRIDTGNEVRYFSYVPILCDEQVRRVDGTPFNEAEFRANTALFYLLFRDGDHFENPRLGFKNFRVDGEGSAVFFDFNNAKMDMHFDRWMTEEDLDELKKEVPGALPILKKKFLQLLSMLDGEDGKKWCLSVLDHAGYDYQAHHFMSNEEFYERFVLKIQSILAHIEAAEV